MVTLSLLLSGISLYKSSLVSVIFGIGVFLSPDCWQFSLHREPCFPDRLKTRRTTSAPSPSCQIPPQPVSTGLRGGLLTPYLHVAASMGQQVFAFTALGVTFPAFLVHSASRNRVYPCARPGQQCGQARTSDGWYARSFLQRRARAAL